MHAKYPILGGEAILKETYIMSTKTLKSVKSTLYGEKEKHYQKRVLSVFRYQYVKMHTNQVI